MVALEFGSDFDALSASSGPLVARWRRSCAALAGCVDLSDVVAAIDRGPDPILAALLAETLTGCQVAPRTILQALLPRLRALAARDPQAGLTDYVTHLWFRIAAYPLERRPRRIAANLLLDTLKAVHAERTPRPLHLRDPTTLPTLAQRVAGADPTPVCPRDLLRTAADLGLVDPPTHATLISVYAEGLSEPAAARLFRVTPTTIRRRCNRGLRVLRAHAHELVAAM